MNLKDLNELNKILQENKQNIKSRKLNKSDLFILNSNSDDILSKCDKIKTYRKQKEFGQKKFIKP